MSQYWKMENHLLAIRLNVRSDEYEYTSVGSPGRRRVDRHTGRVTPGSFWHRMVFSSPSRISLGRLTAPVIVATCIHRRMFAKANGWVQVVIGQDREKEADRDES